MQLLDNISDRQNIAFGNAENSHLWHFQNTDNQYRYNCKITSNSTGKELDAETGFSYFGARHLDHTLITAWLSVDPMADKYPSISPYAYCAWNSVKLVDPDGRDGVKIINRESKTITVKANYYVTTEKVSPDSREIVFTTEEVDRMNKTVNECLNSENYQIQYEGEYYQVVFDLSFFEGGNDNYSKEAAKKDYYEFIHVGNTISIMDYKMLAKFSKELIDQQNDPTLSLGGITDDHKNIYMSPCSNFLRNRIHEIFHTLFFDNDDAPSGIGSYQRLDMPNLDDIYLLITNEELQTIRL